MKLNCDMGESFGAWAMGDDSSVMPYLDMANIACGYHASDPLTMDKTIKLALRYGVEIGAHPGYPDLLGFGRRSMTCDLQEVGKMVIYQTGALSALCAANDTSLSYVKPHGALNNDMMRNDELLESIIIAIASYNKQLKLMIVATPRWQVHQKIAEKHGLTLSYEAFADRLYDDDGQLTSRQLDNAVHQSSERILKQVEELKQGAVTTKAGSKIKIMADALCIHGDNRASIEAAQAIGILLKE